MATVALEFRDVERPAGVMENGTALAVHASCDPLSWIGKDAVLSLPGSHPGYLQLFQTARRLPRNASMPSEASSSIIFRLMTSLAYSYAALSSICF